MLDFGAFYFYIKNACNKIVILYVYKELFFNQKDCSNAFTNQYFLTNAYN